MDSTSLRARAASVPLLRHQQAVALRGATAHAAAKLVELCQAEALRLLHHHDAGVRDIHADFDHGGRNQDLDETLFEALHHGLCFIANPPSEDMLRRAVAYIRDRWQRRYGLVTV